MNLNHHRSLILQDNDVDDDFDVAPANDNGDDYADQIAGRWLS